MSYEMVRARGRLPVYATAARSARKQPPPAVRLGDVEGIFDWFSSDLAAPGDAVLKAWAAQVAARGNHVVRMPSGAQVGKLGERHDTSAGNYTITLAPANVLQADAANVAAGKDAQATDAFFDSVQPGALLKDLGKAVGAGASAITGIPAWAFPVLIIGGGAFLLIQAAHSFLPDKRAH